MSIKVGKVFGVLRVKVTGLWTDIPVSFSVSNADTWHLRYVSVLRNSFCNFYCKNMWSISNIAQPSLDVIKNDSIWTYPDVLNQAIERHLHPVFIRHIFEI